jgi:thioester reductase-like protein
MKVIVTGATGMVGEGVLLECLENPAVERVLVVSRRSCEHTHAKLRECLVSDFRELGAHEAEVPETTTPAFIAPASARSE